MASDKGSPRWRGTNERAAGLNSWDSTAFDPASADPSLVDQAFPARVLLVEEHQLLAGCLAVALRAEGIEASQAPTASHDAIIATAREGRYDVVLLDLDLRPELGYSLSLIEPLQATGAWVVMLTAVTDRERVLECIEAGAIGLITKDQHFDDLLVTLHEAVALGSLLKPAQRDELLAGLRRQRRQREASLEAFEQRWRPNESSPQRRPDAGSA